MLPDEKRGHWGRRLVAVAAHCGAMAAPLIAQAQVVFNPDTARLGSFPQRELISGELYLSHGRGVPAVRVDVEIVRPLVNAGAGQREDTGPTFRTEHIAQVTLFPGHTRVSFTTSVGWPAGTHELGLVLFRLDPARPGVYRVPARVTYADSSFEEWPDTSGPRAGPAITVMPPVVHRTLLLALAIGSAVLLGGAIFLRRRSDARKER